MTELLHRHVAHRAEPGTEDRTMRFVASTTDVDRHDTIIAQDWKLENFNRNPVFLWQHESRRPPVGRVDKWESGEQQSMATVQFASTPFADEVYQLYKGGFLNAVSVGFMAGDYKFIGDTIVMTGNELYELSAVTLPGNANAIAEGRAAGHTQHIDRWARDAFAGALGRTPDLDDIALLTGGARPEWIDKIRSFETLQKRIEVLEAIQKQQQGKAPLNEASEVVRVILQETK